MVKYPREVDKQLDKLANDGSTTQSGEYEDETAAEYVPIYKMMTEDKIPVSKRLGTLWKSRKEAAWARLRNNGELERWDESVRYYRNDHVVGEDRLSQRDTGEEQGVRLVTQGKETENIVFANVSSLVPAIYAKNPTVEVSVDNHIADDWGKVAEKLLNILFRMQSAPGIDLKPKARRAVINCTLTNESWLEVGYNRKETSNDDAMKEIDRISKMLVKAKDTKVIKECEGKLEALEQRIDLLSPSAPFCKVRAGHEVLVDADATMASDCKWMMCSDFVSSDLLRALYGQKNEKGEYESVFEPTHVLKLDESERDEFDGGATFSFLRQDGTKSYKDFGYEDEESYQRAQRTKVWYVWDKMTRRVYLFNDRDWKWPIWVWDDPYMYPNFFPFVRLNFYDDPSEFYARSETTMYLDQQDGINVINNEIAKCRSYIVGKVLYNSSVITDERLVDSFLAGTNEKRCLGIKAPADMDLTKLFSPFVPQSAHMLNTVVFDKTRLLEAIDRVSSVTNVMRGVEYKTNTTNKAIESYESTTQTRLDEKIDAVEDCLGKVGTMLLHVCLHNMETSTVAELLGDEMAAIWDQYAQMCVEGGVKYTATIVGGSTLKPTSATKKQQAVQISQALGQFASAAPVAILVALKVMERAFDEVVIRSEDWEMIMQSIEAQLQQGAPRQAPGTPPPAKGAQGPQPQGGAPQQQPQGGVSIEQVEQLIDNLPDEARIFLANLIQEGTPIRQAVEKVVSELQANAPSNSEQVPMQ